MTSFASILAATDFSVAGNLAVRRAALLAREHGARLHILHVLNAAGCKPLRDWFSPTLDIDLKAAQARAALRRFAVEISGAFDVDASVEVAVGPPFETLLKASEDVDLVVLGRRGHGRLKDLLVGRTVDRMLRICKRPVLVVRTAAEGPYRRVLVPIDFSASSDAAIRIANLMRRAQRLHVFHAIDSRHDRVLRHADVPEHVVAEARSREAAAINARMRRKVTRLGLDVTLADLALAHGPPVPSTLRHARRLGADLIVAGKQGRSSMGTFLLGSVSSRVLREATCDVLIVPRPRDIGPAGALTQGHWIHNEARFVSRGAS